MIAQGDIGGYQALSNWVPSRRTQAERLALLDAKLLNADGPLAALAKAIGEDDAWVAATRAHLRERAAPMSAEEFLRSPASEPWRHLWLGEVGGVHASIVALRGLRYASIPVLSHAADGLEGVQWVDKVGGISALLGRYRVDMGLVVLGAYALVYLTLYGRYRGRTWRVLAPAAVASVLSLAILGLAGQSLQLFHVLALMLLLGVGVDYGIFMQEDPRRGNDAPWLAVGLSAVSTLLSFGLLALSATPALRAFGLTMLLGTALVWLAAPCFTVTIEERHETTVAA
jgi:predicted exporter